MTLLLDVKHVKVASQEETVPLMSMSVTTCPVTLTANVSTHPAHLGVTAKKDTPKAVLPYARVGESIKI